MFERFELSHCNHNDLLHAKVDLEICVIEWVAGSQAKWIQLWKPLLDAKWRYSIEVLILIPNEVLRIRILTI